MINIELEKEAEIYRKDIKSKFFLSEPQLDLACQGFKDGIVLGFNKSNEWHDLRKDPNDLPDMSGSYFVYTGGKPFIIDFSEETNAFGYWCMVLGENLGVCDEVFETIEERDEDRVIAWCEVPLFKE